MTGKLKLLLVLYVALSANCIAQNTSAYASVSTPPSSFHFDATLPYPDSIVYLFNTNVIPNADAEPIRPLLFKIKLPVGLLSTYTAGYESFGFRYPEKQAVYVYLDRFSDNIQDTAYRITNEETIEELLLDKLTLVNYPGQMNIDDNPYDPKRDTWIIKRGKASILLYNINKKAAKQFLDYTTGFTFL